jgi:hypothetical protein
MFLSRPGFRALVISAIVVKAILATATPLGSDFVEYMILVLHIGDKTLAWSPWILLANGIFQLWSQLPIDHGGNIYAAITAAPTSLLPSHYILTAMVKAPILLSDALSGFFVYKIGKSMGDTSLARKASLIWFLNPFVTFLGEMWGSIDLILVCLTLLSVYLVLAEKRIAAAIPIAFATAIRLSPIFAWVGILVWSIRNPSAHRGMFSLALAAPIGMLGYIFWLTQGQLSSMMGILPATTTMYTPVTQAFYQYTDPTLFGASVVEGFAVLAVLGGGLLALETWSMGRWDLINLNSTELLFLLGFAVLPPTSFLWVFPYLALWHARNSRKTIYLVLLFIAIAASLLVFSFADITSNGLSFLFMPMQIVPYGRQLVALVRSASWLAPFFLLIRSIVAGFILAYGLVIFWKALVERSE